MAIVLMSQRVDRLYTSEQRASMFKDSDLNEEANRAFPDDKLLTKDGKPKEFFFSSDAQALVEHTRKVLVIEDGEVVHLKVFSLVSFPSFVICFPKVMLSNIIPLPSEGLPVYIRVTHEDDLL
ncbi:hypothetical protein Syun_026392 [Stephania yunnanensis]|uniref:Uncharacterized protein n=1 Tax=Stephania yunnanensis TaxID=152371 RepID=A0AAP0EYU4_9MAGN